MADKEITELTAGTKPTGAEIVHAVQGGNSRQLTARQLIEIGASVVSDTGVARTPTIADAGKHIRLSNAAAITVTLNTGVFSAGDEIMFEQTGAGVATFVAGAGFSLRSRGTLVATNGQYAVAGLKYISATEAVLFGDLV
jgi:hypothetical protein